MRYCLLSVCLWCFCSFQSDAQNHIRIKANAFSALILIPNVGSEFRISDKLSVQLDVSASFWNSFNGTPFQFVQVFPELRYYTNQDNTGFFAGAHIGFGMFHLTKNRFPFSVSGQKYPKGTYQTGRNNYYGITIGYNYFFNRHWGMELLLGGGSSQSNYKGYNAEGDRIDNIDSSDPENPVITTSGFNKSGEWLPYRGGVMLIYRL